MAHAPINRVGLDGYQLDMLVTSMRGRSLKVSTRSTFVVSAVGEKPDNQYFIDALQRFGKEPVSVPAMFGLLRSARQQYTSQNSFLKIGFRSEVSGLEFTCAYECSLKVNRMKSCVSVAFPFPDKAVTRVTVDFPSDTVMHWEEILELVNDIDVSDDLFDTIASLALLLENFERVQDYLILANEEMLVVQKWKGIAGGFQPTIGLERFIPDI